MMGDYYKRVKMDKTEFKPPRDKLGRFASWTLSFRLRWGSTITIDHARELVRLAHIAGQGDNTVIKTPSAKAEAYVKKIFGDS